MKDVKRASQAVIAFIHPDAGGYIELRRSILRGRRPVRADRRLGTDEKRIRAQSTISYKSKPQAVVAFIHNRVFGTDAPFIRTKNTVGARPPGGLASRRSAQVFSARDSAYDAVDSFTV